MAFRFRRSIRLAPGLRINLSKSGPSLSIGKRGLTHTIGPRGRRTTVGLPGTGISYSTVTRQASPRRGERTGGSGVLGTMVTIVIVLAIVGWLFG